MDKLPELLNTLVTKGDIVVFMGAGTSTKWAHDLPEAWEKFLLDHQVRSIVKCIAND